MSEYIVHKFGGASMKDAPAIINVGQIIERFQQEKTIIVISATGKTTNALEEVVQIFFHDKEQALTILDDIATMHQTIIRDLHLQKDAYLIDLDSQLSRVRSFICTQENDRDAFDFIYDQIVSLGELMSSLILSSYLTQKKKSNLMWQDAREIIRTNSTFREGRINWNETSWLFQKTVKPALQNHHFIITQGFIGSDDQHRTTTLGREGSDYTAAICSFCLDARYMAIWKDVPGVLTADPRLFDNVSLLDRLSYLEAIEMTYYGAKVIHPKTIKPLQNKNIPLYVKSFEDPDSPGTLISGTPDQEYPPVIVVEKNQRMLRISTKDLSFVAEHHLSRIFTLFDKHRIKVNLMRNTAISFTVCITDRPNRIGRFLDEIQKEFEIEDDRDLELITIRHYQEPVVDQMKNGKIVLFEERIPKTVQLVLKPVPVLRRKGEPGI